MKIPFTYRICAAIVLIFIAITGFRKDKMIVDELKGAWMYKSSNEEQVLQFIDGYSTHTVYSKEGKKFIETRGGKYTVNGGKLNFAVEFDTRNKEQVGSSMSYNYSIKGDELTIEANGKGLTFKRIDDGSAPLTGVWHITARMQEGRLVPIHRTGTRKTLKILSGTRFQWAAIDPGKKEFSGTGGGVYEFKDGKYTEHIEFFSRDSNRVGASLGFDGRLDDGEWHHSGLSSKGERIYEVWTKVNDE
jgi:hypothetical protein